MKISAFLYLICMVLISNQNLKSQCYNVALGKPATASNCWDSTPSDAFDDSCFYPRWNAGFYAPQWIQIDLQGNYTIYNINLITEMDPPGNVIHFIYVSKDMATWSLIDSIILYMNDNQLIIKDYSKKPLLDVRGVKVTTTKSPSWIAWKEIGIFSKRNTKTTIIADGPLSFCEGDSVVLTANQGNKFKWNTGATSKSIVVKKTGNYILSVTDACCVNPDNFCSDTVSVFVDVYTNPLSCSPNLIDMGNLTCIADTTITLTLYNCSSSNVDIKQTFFTMGSKSKLMITNGGTFTLSGNESRKLLVNINKYATGTINDTLKIIFPNFCGKQLNVPIKGNKDTIAFNTNIQDTLYLGFTCPNVPLDTLIKVKNISSRATSFTKNKFTSPFAVTGTDPFASLFGLNETKDLHIRFLSSNMGIFYQDLYITDICGKTKIITISAKSSALNTLLQSGTTEGYPGEIIEVPIIMNNQECYQKTGVTGFKTDLSFNSTLLLPLAFTFQKMDETNSKITLDSLMFTKSVGDTLTKVRFKVGLGNAEVCDLTIFNVETLGGSADISIQNGKFKLLGVCPEGEKRLINPNGKIQISSVKPNPAEDKIEIGLDLLELTGYKLSVVNSNGQPVREISCTNNNLGTNSINIDISDLSSGVYSLILQTESERISKRFLIFK